MPRLYFFEGSMTMFNRLSTILSLLLALFSFQQEANAQASALMLQSPNGTPAPAATDSFHSLITRQTDFHVALLVTPIITPALAYAAGNCIGTVNVITGASRFTPPVSVSQGPDFTNIVSISITDKAAQQAPMDIIFFVPQPLGTYVDKTPCSIVADFAQIAGSVSILATDWLALPGTALGSVTKVVNLPVPTINSNLRFILVSRGTPTFVSAADLTIRLFVRED
jgi:hypothetical protein